MIDLFRPYLNHPKVAEMVAHVLTPGIDGRVYVGEGKLVERFEDRVADLLGLSPHPDGEPRILAVNSCTMALTIALDCIGVGPGDEVITTPITCTATSGAIAKTGATLVWADVDPVTGNIDPEDVARKVTARTAAVAAVDWGGRLCDYGELPDFPPVVRDAAHSFLAGRRKYDGDYIAYSFGPIKHLTCGGYGGALVTPPEQTRRARLLRWHGLDRRSSADFRCGQDIEEAGYRGHMTDDQAAVGLANAERVEWVVARHRENAAWFDKALAGLPGIILPPPDPGSSYWLYSLQVEHDRDGFMRRLAERGVASSRVHASNTKHSAFRRQARGADSVPNADLFDARHLAIPVGWWVTPEDRETVAQAVWEAAMQREAAYA